MYTVCEKIHAQGKGLLAGGKATLFLGFMSDDYLSEVREAEAAGLLHIEEGWDFGDELLVVCLSDQGRQLLGLPAKSDWRSRLWGLLVPGRRIIGR